MEIDHINGIRTDCRIENLRLVTSQENLQNSKNRSDNTSGKRGVSFWKTGNAWRAIVHSHITGKQIIKTFSVAKYGNEEAFDMACEARDQMLEDLNNQGAKYTTRHGEVTE